MSVKKKLVISIIVISTIAVLLVSYFNYSLHYATVDPTIYTYSNIKFEGSALSFHYEGLVSGTTVKGISTRYDSDNLYIKLKGGLYSDGKIPYPLQTIDLKVTNPSIEKIYIESGFGFKKVLIWDKNKPQ